MTSQINPNDIDGTYPVAGQANNTQGFRDNFTNIKTNFSYAETEISELQTNGIFKSALPGTTLDNNMSDNLLYAVKLQDVSFTEVQLAQTSGSVTLDYAAGMYQAIPGTTGNISLGFTNWPASGSVGVLRFAIVITSIAHTLTLPATVNVGIRTISGISPGTPGVSNTITFAETGTYIFEFITSNGGTNISIQDMVRPATNYQQIITISNTTPSTSRTTGALVVAGGVGISGNLTANAANVTMLTVSGTTNLIGAAITGNLNPTTTNTYTLGNVTNKWADVWIGPSSIHIEDTGNAANIAVLQVTNGSLLINGVQGLQANLISGNTTLKMTSNGNIAMSMAGTSNVAVFSTAGEYITGLLSATGNVTGGNINTLGSVLANDGGAVGYGTGAGGTVSQTGNKSTGVTLNKTTGEITMQATTLSASTSVSFTLTNSTIGARDLLLINLVGGGTAGAYTYGANCAAGSAVISVRNVTLGSLSEALVLRYAVIRGAIA